MDNDNFKFGQKIKKIKIILLSILILVGFIFIFSYYFLSYPLGSKDVIIHISSGQSVDSVVDELKDKKAIRNNLTLKVFIKFFKKGNGIIAGDYLIEKKSPVWVVAWQLGQGKHKIEPIKITIREGLTNIAIADLLADKLAGFRRDLFLSQIENMQGYLFPDTYFFFPHETPEEIVKKLSDNFNQRIKNIDINNKNLRDVIIMASILEGEANGKEDIKIISGILWKRISLGMPLQVDVDKNTYEIKGLPVAPLNNPGLLSIESAVNPVSSPYLYYLHDKNGKVHYAINFEEHKNNINKYLK
jgi:UPF0755 protein